MQYPGYVAIADPPGFVDCCQPPMIYPAASRPIFPLGSGQRVPRALFFDAARIVCNFVRDMTTGI